MDLLVEKGNNKTYLSQLGFLVTSFEEGAPTIARNSTNIQGRSGSVDFGGWHESKKVKLEGFYRAEDQYEEETLKERLFALLSDPEGIYITEMRGEIGQGFERPGETEGEVYEHMMTRPSHKRFYVYASSIENELQGNVGGTVLYKTSVEFTTLKLPYGESVPRDLDVKLNAPYYGTNLLTGTGYHTVTGSNAYGYLSNETIDDLLTLFKGLEGQTVTVSVDYKYSGFIAGSGRNRLGWESSIIADSISRFGQWHYPNNDSGSGRMSSTFEVPKNITSLEESMGYIQFSGSGTGTLSHLKLEKGNTPTPWTPAPEDQEYNKWYLDTYYNTDNLVIPYAGTVPCNQLEQGFTVEFTAKEGGSGLKIDINGKEFVYDGQVYDGDVLKLSGYEYTKNGFSVVRTTNKAYFELLPNVNNTLSASLHGTIKVLNFQNLYA